MLRVPGLGFRLRVERLGFKVRVEGSVGFLDLASGISL